MTRTPAIEFVHVGMTFGSFAALEDVNWVLEPHRFHVLLGENGAGKSTLVKCLVGFQKPTSGQIVVNGEQVEFSSSRQARAAGLGMVYQHFTLADNLTVLENFLVARDDVPFVLSREQEARKIGDWMQTMPFQLPLDVPAGALSAGEKQKLEILMQLYHRPLILVLDEPSSVLTPDEADEVLGLLKRLVEARELTVLLITHKFREFEGFGDTVAVLRKGRLQASGPAAAFTQAQLGTLMIGEEAAPAPERQRLDRAPGAVRLGVRGLTVEGTRGTPALRSLSLEVREGEIYGVAGVSGNGQKELVETLMGLHPRGASAITLGGEPFRSRRSFLQRQGLALLPELPLRNACVGDLGVWENLSVHAPQYRPQELLRRAKDLQKRFGIKAAHLGQPIRTLSGGNVQRAVLARELRDNVKILVVANPCFGLDFAAAAEIRTQIIEARNRGVAVLLVSEDLDEVLEVADRVGVISEGRIVWEAPREAVDRAALGRALAGQGGTHAA